MRVDIVTHIHSSYSYDGKLSMKALRSLFSERGIRVVCMTEHSDEMTEERARDFIRECDDLSDENFVFVPGFEVSYHGSHVLMIGTRSFLARHADADTLRRWRSESALAFLAHPHRNRFRMDEAESDVIDGIEVWNAQYDGKRLPRPRSFRFLNGARREKPNLLAVSGLDFHRAEHAAGPVLTCEIPELSQESVLSALRDGCFDMRGPRIAFPATATKVPGHPARAWMASAVSIVVIIAGKAISASCTRLGLSLPKGLKARIRSWV